LLPLAGCRNRVKSMEFDDFMVRSNRKLAKAALEFKKTLPGETGALDPVATRNAYDKLKDAMAEIRKDMQETVGPRGVRGDAMRKAYTSFLDGQESLINNEFKDIVGLVEDRDINPTERSLKIAVLLTKISIADAAALNDLKATNKTFAEYYLMKIVSNRAGPD